MIKVTFIFERAYSFNDEPVEELTRYIPFIPRKGDEVDFIDFLYTKRQAKDHSGMPGSNIYPGLFEVDLVSLCMDPRDGNFESIAISLIPIT